MRKILTSAGALAAACLLTVGLTTSASAATGTAYLTQNGQTTTYTNPVSSLAGCISSDPTKGPATFLNRTDAPALTFTKPGCHSQDHYDYLRIGQQLTLPAGSSIVFTR